jgi:putative molybdopterin biosynthesis protein
LSTLTLLTTKEVAALLRVHPKQVYRLMKRGLPAMRVGDEWRFGREEVLRWAAKGAAAPAQPVSTPNDGTRAHGEWSPNPASPGNGLIAANGDWVVEVLLAHLRQSEGALWGLVLSDHAGGHALLSRGRVLAAGSHAGIKTRNGLDDASRAPNTASLQLVTREVGLAMRTRPFRHLRAIAGKRVATRPPTAGLRAMLDGALSAAGIDLSATRASIVEYACHRDVTLAVAQGKADVGLTTHAWAYAAGLQFFPMASEDYELRFVVERMGDPRIVALCEAAQSHRFRQDLRRYPGYRATRTGQIRFG